MSDSRVTARRSLFVAMRTRQLIDQSLARCSQPPLRVFMHSITLEDLKRDNDGNENLTLMVDPEDATSWTVAGVRVITTAEMPVGEFHWVWTEGAGPP